MKLTCDKCGQDVKDGDLRYTSADRPEEGTARHARCHVGIRDEINTLNARIEKAQDTLKQLRDQLK